MHWIASLLVFFIISSPIIDVVVKEAYWTNIVESVQIFECLNKLPLKSPLYEANEFQVLEPLLVAMFWIYGIIFVAFFFVLFPFFLCLYVNMVTKTGLQIPDGVGQGTCRVGAWVLCSCSWRQLIIVVCLLYNFYQFVSATSGHWL